MYCFCWNKITQDIIIKDKRKGRQAPKRKNNAINNLNYTLWIKGTIKIKIISKVVLPKNPFKDIAYNKRGLREHHNKNHVCPCILPKLILVHLLL